MTRKRFLLHHPASELELPKLGQRLPKCVLNSSQAEDVLAAVSLASKFGLRDRSILETLYSTGIRRMELVNLELANIDDERGIHGTIKW